MLKIIENDILRGSTKIGWVESNRILNENGEKIGYIKENYVYNKHAEKIAYVEGNYLYTKTGAYTRIPLDVVAENVVGGTYPMLMRCAIYLLMGA